MKDEEDFRIIEEHNAEKQNESADEPTAPSEPEYKGADGSFDTDSLTQSDTQPAESEQSNKTPPAQQENEPKRAKKGISLWGTPKKRVPKTQPSDYEPPSSQESFSKPLFPQEPEEQISPEGVVLTPHDQKKQQTPSFEETRKDFSRSDILLEEKPTTPVRDPLFAAHVLSEQKRDGTQDRAPERPIQVPGTRGAVDKERSEKKPQGSSIVRTYESDVAQALKKGQTSLTKMVMDEEGKRKQKKSAQSKQRVKMLGLLGGALLLVLAAGAVISGALFYRNFTQTPQTDQMPQTQPALFLVEETVSLTLGEEPLLSSIESTFARLTGDLDSIIRIHITESQPAGEGGQSQDVALSADEFFTAAGISAPDSLRRSLLEDFVLGAYMFDGTQPFLVLKTDSFESAFSGLLQWEENGLAQDMASLFGLNAENLSEEPFADYVLKNRDLRARESQDGSLFVFYTFIDQNTIVIATEESTLDEVMRRIYRAR